MRLKIKLIIWILILGQICKANMSSPFLEGTFASTAFSSKDVNILSELIKVKIDSVFETARFTIEYTIQSEISGQQIPLLFYAKDFKGDFLVWLDSVKIKTQNIPEKYIHIDQTPFANFKYSINKANGDNEPDEIAIFWFKNIVDVCKINDLKYFEANIEKGIHKIRVEYTAKVWIDNSDWITEYSFRYALTPAKFWKSFGRLDIYVEQTSSLKNYTTNLGRPNEKGIEKFNSWSFNKLPDEYFVITYIPAVSKLAQIAIHISPIGFLIIIGLILIVIHFWLLIQYRKRNINKKHSIIVIVGSILIPFLVLLSYIYSYEIIDGLIGNEAGSHHGYVFLIILLYPIILPIYWTIIWRIDKFIKREFMKK